MFKDRYDYPLSTASPDARDAYIIGVDRLLSASAKTEDAFRRSIDADDGFALAHVALARTLQVQGRGSEAKAPLARALELAARTTAREQSQVAIFGQILQGQGATALEAIRVHIQSWPRDAMALALDGLDADTHLHVSFDMDFLDPEIAPGGPRLPPGWL